MQLHSGLAFERSLLEIGRLSLDTGLFTVFVVLPGLFCSGSTGGIVLVFVEEGAQTASIMLGKTPVL
jgi:hypothetical protein